MKPWHPGLLCIVLAGCSGSNQSGNEMEVDDLYRGYCASCHGERLTGGLGSSLIDGVWNHGSSDAEIAANIKNGIPDMGMPAWGKSLSDEDIMRLVIFIREMEAGSEAVPAKSGAAQSGFFDSGLHKFQLHRIGEGTGLLWSLDFLPDGDILVTQRDGNLWRFSDGQRFGPIQGTPAVRAESQGGLLAVQLHPDYTDNGWIYLSFSSKPADSSDRPNGSMTKVVRGRIKNDKWIDQETIFQVPEAFLMDAGHHYGSRFVFQGGYLFFSIGDRGTPPLAQDLRHPAGKIHRIHDDGRIPADNPYADQKDAFPSVWSYGHRNPQGMDLDPATGTLWAAEHGPRGGDEINLIEKGLNYGWPEITYGMNYDGTPVTDKTHQEGMEQPRHYWVPSIAVSAIEFYTGDQFPRWQNHLLVASMALEQLHRLVIKDGKVLEDEILMKGQGRIRDLTTGPDGYVYLLINDAEEPHDGALYRLQHVR